MIFRRPIFAPNVIIIDLEETILGNVLPQIVAHLNISSKVIGVNAVFDDSASNYSHILIHQEDYEIYRHFRVDKNALSNQLLDLNVKVVYYLEANSDSYRAAFVHLFDLIGEEYPILCVSNSLSKSIESVVTIVEALPDDEVKLKNPRINYKTVEQFLQLNFNYENNRFVQI